MSVFGSMFTASSGLQAQSQSLGMISNNIANVSTVGYKRNDAAFQSLVTTENMTTLYSPGAVKAVQNARISLQGTIQQSQSATDLAITGNGMFVVRTPGGSEPLFTRAGSFTENVNGLLQNTSGYILQGWPLDQNGDIIGSAGNIGSLVPVDVAFQGGISQTTTAASFAAALNANQPVSTASADFTRTMTVYDSLGNANNVNLNFKKLESTNGSALGTVDLGAQAGNFSPGTDTFTVNGDTITLDGNVNKLLTDLNALTNIYAYLDANGRLNIEDTSGGNLTLADGVGTPLANNVVGVNAGVFAASAPPATLTGAATVNTPNPNGWWMVEFTTNTGTVETGAVNFNTDGSLNAAADVNGQINIALGWTPPGAAPLAIDLDLAGLRQQSSDYTVISTGQNGSPLGFKTGVSIGSDGVVTAQFSNGLSRQVYQLAVATFPNANGLSELNGNVYRESDTSGTFNLLTAGAGGAGLINGGALEGSNVDLADEFSKMIITQRAYSANTKVITTADEMTAELLRIR
ncbi:MAG: flagellar hook protein FlgE [Alphaproteobacteria bacterium]